MSHEPPHKNALGRIEWVMTEARHVQGLVNRNRNPGLRVLVTTDPADERTDHEITELRLYAPGEDPLRQFPERVRGLLNLECLALGPDIDPAMLAQIKQDSIPPRVSALRVFTGGLAATWPRTVSLPNVLDLRTDAPLALAPNCFPSLRAISIKPTRNRKNLDAVLECKDLSEIQLLTVPGSDVFRSMQHLPVTRLGLLGGKLETLDGIDVLPRIRWLLLHNLREFKSLAAITALRDLEELEIRYCKKIEDITCLAQLPKLRRLQVIACGDLGLSRIKSTLDGLSEVMLSASS